MALHATIAYHWLMALIACPECSAEVSDRAPACPRCGVPIASASELVVIAPVQTMVGNPLVKVTWQGREVGKVGRGQSLTLPVDKAGTVRFSANGRSAELAVKPGAVTRIQLSWARMSGKLHAERIG